MADYTWQDLRDLEPEWERIFGGETMPYGFMLAYPVYTHTH